MGYRSPKSEATDDEILEAMNRYGGSFITALASLFRRADPENQHILRRAFAHYWTEYRDLVEARRAPACPRCGSYRFQYQGDRQVCDACGHE
jgi:ribosomal protein S27AE